MNKEINMRESYKDFLDKRIAKFDALKYICAGAGIALTLANMFMTKPVAWLVLSPAVFLAAECYCINRKEKVQAELKRIK